MLGIKKTNNVNATSLAKQRMEVLTQPDNIWVKLINSKYLKNSRDFLSCNKPEVASTAWKNILDEKKSP